MESALYSASIARKLLYLGVAGVLVVAAERPAHGSVAVAPADVLTRVDGSTREQREPSLELARTYLQTSRRDGDPRYLGLAEGVLDKLAPSREGAVLRATLLQSRHEFPAALAELERVLREGEDPQARLIQATILTVRADYDAARDSCRALPPSVYALACTASIDAITGQQERARMALERALGSEQRAWVLSLLGEQAYWLGDPALAERQLRASLALEDDRYTRALLDDLALDAGEDARCDDLHLALRELAQGGAGDASARVEAAFQESHARGDRVHLREEARFELARGHRTRALRLARENWQVQREPWDARILLAAASTRDEAAPALAWLQRTGFASPILHTLAARLETP